MRIVIKRLQLALLLLSSWAVVNGQPTRPEKPFVIQVVDEATNRPVPLVEISTVHQVTHITDNHGITAWNEPELAGEEVFFQVKSHGYELQADGFGFKGRKEKVVSGGRVQWKLKRTQIAERLYRITGAGRLAESQSAGLISADDPNAITRARVIGQDSVQMTPYKNELHWLWGDTSRLSYPLGNFHSPSARSSIPGPERWNPESSIPIRYFTDKTTGFAAETCRMKGDGPTWASAMTTVRDSDGNEKLVCWYAKIKPPLETYQRGVAVWNDHNNVFESLVTFGPQPIGPPDGSHDLKLSENGQEWIYFADPFPYCRVKATLADYSDPEKYEYWTCVKSGPKPGTEAIDRDMAGKLQFQWRRNSKAWDQKTQQEWIGKKQIQIEECPIQLKSKTGESITTARGTVSWNKYRKKWLMVFGQIYGKPSLLGEIWIAESEDKLGPWKNAIKILTHDKYSFYNVAHHAELDSGDGRTIYLEGTYTTLFSGNEHPTPRYDYNQMLYRLVLSDPRLTENATHK
jgi:hypothetical protein